MKKRIILVIITLVLSIGNFILFWQYGPPITMNYYYLDFMFDMSPLILIFFILVGVFYKKQPFIKHYTIANIVLLLIGIFYLIVYVRFLSNPDLFDLYVDLSMFQLVAAFYAVYVSVKVSQSQQYLWPVYSPMVTINSIYALLVPALWHERFALSITALLGQDVYYWIMIALYIIVTISMVTMIIALDIDSKKKRKDFDKEVLYVQV
jgi:hypothetical protein